MQVNGKTRANCYTEVIIRQNVVVCEEQAHKVKVKAIHESFLERRLRTAAPRMIEVVVILFECLCSLKFTYRPDCSVHIIYA